MTRHDDTDLITGQLTDRIEQVLDHYNPGWIAHKGVAYLSAKSNKDLGSFKVNLTGGRRGQWYRFSAGFGGGPVSLLAYLLKGCSSEPAKSDLADAFAEARKFLGLDSGEIDTEAGRRAKQRREQAIARQQAEEAQSRVYREEQAMQLWQESVDPVGNLAEVYFKWRVCGWEGFPSDVIRFHPQAYYSPTQKLPCVVCRVDGPDGNPVGVWRIFLNEDGTNFRDEEGYKVKKGLGPCMEKRGAIRLFPATGGTIGVCEGVETAFGAYFLNWKEIPIWPCMATSGLVKFQPPFGIDRVFIFPDGDRHSINNGKWMQPPGMKAALTLHSRLIEEGLVCAIDPVPEDGSDHLDRYNAAYKAGMRVGGEIAA